jgi:hypothetical protein
VSARRRVTRPKQAGSARTLDRMQKEVETLLAGTRGLYLKLAALHRMIVQAERR